MQRDVGHVFIWSGEKIFTVEAVTNTQNCRLYARDAEDLPEGSHTHLRRTNPAEVIVWAVVASDVYKSHLFFIKECVKAYLHKYIDRQSVILDHLNFGNRHVFIQGGNFFPDTHIEFDRALVQRSFHRDLRQRHVASLKSRHQPNGHCYLDHLRE